MGHNKRPMPVRLGEKLKAIREHFEVSTSQLIARLDCPSIPLHRSSIIKYEQGVREPSTIVLLAYARLAQVPMEVLADDKLDLQLK